MYLSLYRNYFMSDDITQLLLDDARVNMSDRDLLRYTRRLKLKQLDALTPDDRMPTDAKEVYAVLAVMDSLDNSAHKNIKLDNEANGTAAVAEAIALIASINKQVGNKDPFMTDVSGNAPRVVTIDTPLVESEFLPGELSNDVVDLTYDSFVEDFESKNKSGD